MEPLTSTVDQTIVLPEVRPNALAKRMIEIIVTLDAKYSSIRNANLRSCLGRMDATGEQLTGHQQQIWQSK